ncbi:MAG TPA: zinc ribbon domain-containing protein [Syntrophales bacterium]|nr:zinc ribbon domain-containing protein [Syntrophales bacterium]HPX11997.1 zinc ribbon domain-containing protein [Syntrophales bacterium]HQB31679.1 zinc ribbon domain-containing protein [Syntrophales bacterium]HQN79253.1 zinc ribbon domain-containing protein [Syntrophales bacterium]HQQ28650.1 zinc ribbon domain-containing protein [Syntrophales bacterium]
MPIYEYKCRKCGKQFELFQKMSDEDIRSCRFCDGPVKKLMSLSSFHLKGSGWYTTDYGGKKPSTTEREKKEETKTETAAPSSSETAAKKE